MSDSQRGILIAVEGIDGAGKTTQVELLAEALRSVGEPPILSKEPTSGYWGQKIRKSATNGRLSLDEELEAFINDRTEHVQRVIQPALDRGAIVILDRYFYSTIAYQGSRGANIEMLKAEMETRFPIPDAVFLLVLDPKLAVFRIHSRDDGPNEFEHIDALIKVQQVFDCLEGPIVRLDGSVSIPVVHAEMLRAFTEGPLKKKRCSKDYGCDDPFHCTPAITGNCEWWNTSRKLLATLHRESMVR